jgi:Ca-activated chloride channel homolog
LKRVYLLFILFLLVLTSCDEEKDVPSTLEEGNPEEVESNSNLEEDKPSKNDDFIVGPKLPTSLAELEALPVGYTKPLVLLKDEEKKLTDELTKNLPDISGNPTKEELDRYYEAVLSVFQQDFIGPGKLIEQFKFQSIGNPDIEEPRYQFKENLNVMVILDASGSMGNMEGNQTRMNAAKNAITEFVKGLPKEANVGLRIYGHKGTGSNADKALSCSSSELIYPLSSYDATSFEQALSRATPAGWTPISLALTEAQKDLSVFKGETNTNIIYLVSDGISTCDDQPVEAAKALYNSDITPIVNIIGFNVNHEGQKQLQEIAKATEGTYKYVSDEQSLQEHLNEAKKIADKWKSWKKSNEGAIEKYRVGNWLDIFGYHTKEYVKWVDERQTLGFTLTYLFQDKEKMSRESHDYLTQKNKDYHKWIEQEYNKLRDELEALNEQNYAEAMKQLEEKYLTNTSTP